MEVSLLFFLNLEYRIKERENIIAARTITIKRFGPSGSSMKKNTVLDIPMDIIARVRRGARGMKLAEADFNYIKSKIPPTTIIGIPKTKPINVKQSSVPRIINNKPTVFRSGLKANAAKNNEILIRSTRVFDIKIFL